jgi:UDP-N-acetylmuramoylalanine--D-glutamate ligase
MSSFQLEEFQELKRSPHVAALTNVYPDHLNRYRDMDEYAWAKAQIFLHQQPRDTVVLNFDNGICTRLRPKAIAQVVWFSRTRAIKQGARQDRDWLVWNDETGSHKIFSVADLIAGQHNIENALAAIAITKAWGAENETIAETLREFKSVPHRLELVRELDGVQYINDTTATAPSATIAALNTLAGRSGTIYLIAGGFDKGLPYPEMARTIVNGNVRVILLDGTATAKIEQTLQQAEGEARIIARAKTLQEAVERGRASAQAGDVVLLSPGAASFGMFANEFERGDVFREIVMGLHG